PCIRQPIAASCSRWLGSLAVTLSGQSSRAIPVRELPLDTHQHNATNPKFQPAGLLFPWEPAWHGYCFPTLALIRDYPIPYTIFLPYTCSNPYTISDTLAQFL